MDVIRPIFTADDLAQLPEDGRRYEIVGGDLAVSPSPSQKHQRCVWQLAAFFHRVEHAGGGRGYVAPFDVMLDEYNVVEPDLLFIRADRLALVTEANVQGPPDLIVEVLSPSTRARDLGVKAHLYARFGVSEYWVVDPDAETLAAYSLTPFGYDPRGPFRSGETVVSPLFPDTPLMVSDVFRP